MIYTILHTIHAALLLDFITFFIEDFPPSKSGYILQTTFLLIFRNKKAVRFAYLTAQKHSFTSKTLCHL